MLVKIEGLECKMCNDKRRGNLNGNGNMRVDGRGLAMWYKSLLNESVCIE